MKEEEALQKIKRVQSIRIRYCLQIGLHSAYLLEKWHRNLDRLIKEIMESYARSNAIEFAAYVHKQTLDNPKGWIKGRLDAKIYDTWKKGGE